MLEYTGDTIKSRIITFLAKSGNQPYTIGQIARMIHKREDRVRGAMVSLMELGVIEKTLLPAKMIEGPRGVNAHMNRATYRLAYPLPASAAYIVKAAELSSSKKSATKIAAEKLGIKVF